MSTPLGEQPAFPHAFQRARDISDPARYAGMSTRTWLAGLAMQGLLANQEFRIRCSELAKECGSTATEGMAVCAVEYADRLLAALEGSEPPTPASVSPEPQNPS